MTCTSFHKKRKKRYPWILSSWKKYNSKCSVANSLCVKKECVYVDATREEKDLLMLSFEIRINEIFRICSVLQQIEINN